MVPFTVQGTAINHVLDGGPDHHANMGSVENLRAIKCWPIFYSIVYQRMSAWRTVRLPPRGGDTVTRRYGLLPNYFGLLFILKNVAKVACRC